MEAAQRRDSASIAGEPVRHLGRHPRRPVLSARGDFHPEDARGVPDGGAGVRFFRTARYRRSLPHRGLAAICFMTIGGLTFVFATFSIWWAGQCYGARFFTDAVPWFYLLAVLGCAAIPEDRRRLGSNPMLAVGAVLRGLGIGMNARGALSWDTMKWNEIRPPQMSERVLDWSQPQFLAGWVRAH